MTPKIKISLYIFLSLALFTARASALSWKSGDLVLVSLPCYVCRMIELEEKSQFSHIGMIVRRGKQIHVLEAWGVAGVQLTPWKNFIARLKKSSTIAHGRIRERQSNLDLAMFSHKSLGQWIGLPYDPHFLWDNHNEKKRENLYCSELIYKFLKHWGREDLLPPLAPMHFDYRPDLWKKYFSPDGVPVGKIGLSPEGWFRSPAWAWTMLQLDE